MVYSVSSSHALKVRIIFIGLYERSADIFVSSFGVPSLAFAVIDSESTIVLIGFRNEPRFFVTLHLRWFSVRRDFSKGRL